MRKRIILTAMLTFILSFEMSATSFAKYDSEPYTITVYAGKQGIFTEENGGELSADGKKWTKKCKRTDNNISISTKALGLEIKEKDKYYDRGFRIAGHDNDEIEDEEKRKKEEAFVTMTFDDVDQDVDYMVAYGIKGAMVAYTINYVDSSGKSLHKSDTYYGMEGDKPVVSYRYVEGYYPNAYTQGKRLVANEKENVFTFTYTAIPANTNTTVRPASAPGTTSNSASSSRVASAASTTNRSTTSRTTSNRSTTGTGTSSSNSSNRTGTSSSSSSNRASDDSSSSSSSSSNSSSSNSNADDDRNTTTLDDEETPLVQPEQYIDIDEEPATFGEFISDHKVPFIIGGIALLGAIGGLIAGLIVHSKNKKKREAEAEEEPGVMPAGQ